MADEDDIREQAQIFRKGSLSKYQAEINRVAGDICTKNPALLVQRGKLLDMAQKHIDEQGYQYKKNISRSKYFGQSSESEPVAKRPKYNKETRMERISEIKGEIVTVDKRIKIKQKLLNQRVGERKFSECDSISEAIDQLQKRCRSLAAELRVFQKKEERAITY